MYKMFIRPLLFLVDAEKIHHAVFSVLKVVGRIPGGRGLLSLLYGYHHKKLARTVCGITFPNPVGLAAGFDKNAVLIDELSCLGFGFIEIGTLTPRPQAGNPKPRLFRLPVDQALINRMGFNNDGVLVAAESLKKRRSNIIVGGNIGKNKDTPNELATDDYTYAFEVLYNYVDYFVLNVSSPNTPGLRALQEKEPLTHLLRHIKALSLSRPDPKPVFLKIAPDLTEQQLNDIVEILQSTGTDGVIATNTTIARDGLKTSGRALSEIGAGGLSGAPLQQRSNEIIRYLRQRLGPKYPIIGVGGIMSVNDAIEKLQAGADLIQLYTGFIYEGPAFAKRINKALIAQFDTLAK